MKRFVNALVENKQKYVGDSTGTERKKIQNGNLYSIKENKGTVETNRW